MSPATILWDEGGARVRLGELIHGLQATIRGPAGAADTRICDLTEDSRSILPGSLFVARRGLKSDGRQFIPAALDAGAAAILADDPALTLPTEAPLVLTQDIELTSALIAERFYGNASRSLALAGITGTNGKTTTAYLLHQLLNRAGLRCGMIGTVCIDDGAEVAPASLTTPPAMELSRTLATMVETGCRACVMETSSHALHQRRTGALGFSIGVFTNLTHDHLDYHHTMEAYADAKALLFESLPATGHAIVNADDPAHTRMLRDTPASILRCSLDPASKAECSAHILAHRPGGMTVAIRAPFGRFELPLPLVGAHNAMNALQAAAAAHALGLPASAIESGLARASAPPGRLEPVTRAADPFSVFVDYAHTDDALARALSALRHAGAARLTVVFGCGGDRDPSKRPKMGRVACELADRVIITSDNPRTEAPGAIIDQVLAGARTAKGQAAQAEVHADRARAIHAAIASAHEGEVIIIAGKGHETYQILPDPSRPGATITRHFDDREEARAALAARGIAAPAPPGAHPLRGATTLPARPRAHKGGTP
ncbi:MAG: UDP-N-acetylmuramoyl-L-alanyl-D-glutamate--2,6-diaminopimelate ligase [Phycisphaerales bacterium]